MIHTALVRAPLRVSFVGGGSDLPPGQGAVISSAIDKFVWCVARRRLDHKVYLTWTEKEIVDSVGGLKHDLAREILLMRGWQEGIELLTFADVPGVGSGLGSSSATCVAILYAVLALQGYSDEEIDREWLAELACEVSICRLEKPQGRQDEYASAIGGFQEISFNCGVVRNFDCIELSPHTRRVLEDHLLLFSSGGNGRKADDILRSFNDTQDFRIRCIDLVNQLRDHLDGGEIDELGDLIAEHHAAKMLGFSEYSKSDSVFCLPNGLKAPDNLRFKLCGAGQTGHLLCFVEPEQQAFIREQITRDWGPELPFRLNPNGVELIYAE